MSLCPRGFAIPVVVIADMLSARVAGPLLISLWIANPQGQRNSPNLEWSDLYCGRQTNKSTGSYIYIYVDGNDKMMEYFFEHGEVPNSSSESAYNYFVKFG